MSRTRTLVLAALVVVLGFVVYHALSPWGWTAQLQVPAGVPAKSVSYTCGPPWGSGYVHGPAATAYPVAGTPCGQRREYQVMVGVDLLAGVLIITAAGLLGRARSRP